MTTTDAAAPTATPARAKPRLLLPLLFGTAVLTSAYGWWLVALPLFAGRVGAHADHAWPLYLHAIGGTLMLLCGSAALFIGWTRRGFAFHRLFGATYLLGGAAASIAAIGLNLVNPHDDLGTALATGTLAAAWLLAAAMAFRAIRNRRIDTHREWMIRSYVLTWSFVLCRMVQQGDWIAALGPGAASHVIWTTWIVPLFACELALQWGRGGPAAPRSGRRSAPAG
jgi:uncharacterized membrane protein